MLVNPAVTTVPVRQVLNELRDGLNMVKRDMSITAQRLQRVPQGVPACPQTGGCLTLAVFLGVCAVQMVVILGFLSYR